MRKNEKNGEKNEILAKSPRAAAGLPAAIHLGNSLENSLENSHKKAPRPACGGCLKVI